MSNGATQDAKTIEEENRTLRGLVTRLEERLSRLEGVVGQEEASAEVRAGGTPVERLDRRSALRNLGKAAAASVGVAAASGMLRPSPAYGTTHPLVVGSSNDAEANETQLASTNAFATFDVHNNNSSSGSAVVARSTSRDAVLAMTYGHYGFEAVHPDSAGGRAHARFSTAESTAVGPPTGGTHSQGELFMDSEGVLWICQTGGSPGTWYRPVYFEGVNESAELGETTTLRGGAAAGSGVLQVESATAGPALRVENTADDGLSPFVIVPTSAAPQYGDAGALLSYDNGGFSDLYYFHDTDNDKDGDAPTAGKVFTSQFANFIEFITPTRVLNTLEGGKNHPGTQGTPLDGGSDPSNPNTFTIDISGEGLPEGALGFIGTATIVTRDGDGDPISDGGYISVWNSGAWPGTASVTGFGDFNVGATVISGLTSGGTFQLAVQASKKLHVVIDVIAVVVSE